MVSEYTRGWLRKALGDLTVMRHEFRLPPSEAVGDAICFHAQQAIEKLLKAYLAEHGVDFPKTHNLKALLAQCKSVDGEFVQVIVGDLSDFAVEIRYPDDMFTVSPEDWRRSVEMAEAAVLFVLGKLGLTERDLA